MQKRKILVLGAATTQIPLYETAKKLGIATVDMSIAGDYPGFALADETAIADISNPEEVKRIAAERQVDGIVTCGLDTGVAGMGLACETLGLPGPGALACRTVRDKYLTKQALLRAGVQAADCMKIEGPEDLSKAALRFGYPLVLKAVDLMGSRGIFRCDSPEETKAYYPQVMAATKMPYCIAEEYLDGKLFGVEAMMQRGKLVYMMPNNTESSGESIQKPIGHSFPFARPELLEEVRTQLAKAIAAVGLDNCPVNCDCMLVGDKVNILELTGRCGSNALPELVGLKYHINYYEAVIRLALGEDVTGFFADEDKALACISHSITSRRSGTLRRIHNFAPVDKDVLELSFLVEPGDEIRAYTNGRDCIGKVVVQGADYASCEAKLRSVLEQVNFELEQDLPVEKTPLQYLRSYSDDNRIYCKRDDLQPFSFGGNKARLGAYWLRDMEEKGCDAMLLYGGYGSNLCRVLALACAQRGIPAAMVYCSDDVMPAADSANGRLIAGSGVRAYPAAKGDIATAVQRAMDDFRAQGRKPYYIHGDAFGRGNEIVPLRAAAALYEEIREQEAALGKHFSYIFLAASTGETQAGLLCAQRECADRRTVVGISVNRKKQRGEEELHRYLDIWRERYGQNFPEPPLVFEDAYLSGGYGLADAALKNGCIELYRREGIAADYVYAGKAFCGMLDYLKAHEIHGEDVLFLHTGGTPLFWDELKEMP